MTKQERIKQLKALYQPDYSSGTTPYAVGDDEGYQRGITEGYELGYDEAIDKAVKWLRDELYNYLWKGEDDSINVTTDLFNDFTKAMEE